MVTYAEVGKRHAAYASAVVVTILFAEHTLFLTALLCGVLAGVKWHMGTPSPFLVAIGTCGPLAAALCVKLSHHSWWYAHGMDWIGVPLWLPPLHAIFAHWILDAYWLVTLRDARKSTLP